VRELSPRHGPQRGALPDLRKLLPRAGLVRHSKKGDIAYSQELDLDLGTVVPSVAGPKRPQDRIELPKLKQEFISSFSSRSRKMDSAKPARSLAKVCASLRRVASFIPAAAARNGFCQTLGGGGYESHDRARNGQQSSDARSGVRARAAGAW